MSKLTLGTFFTNLVLPSDTYKTIDPDEQHLLDTDYFPFGTYIKWEPCVWNGIKNINGYDIWSDGVNIYYSNGKNHYKHQDGIIWGPMRWEGLNEFNGRDVWTDGTNIYYSYGLHHYILNGITWEPITFKNLDFFEGHYIWTDGTNTYYSFMNEQYMLSGDTWYKKIWDNIGEFDGDCIWYSGSGEIYFSNSKKQLKLNNGVWEYCSWYGSDIIEGNGGIWTYNSNTYYSYGTKQYKLNINKNIWEPIVWHGLTDFYGLYIWSDSKNIYYSIGDNQYKLNVSKTRKISTENLKNGISDIHYDPLSKNPQSGMAVAEAINNTPPIIPINPSPVPTKEGSIWITT